MGAGEVYAGERRQGWGGRRGWEGEARAVVGGAIEGEGETEKRRSIWTLAGRCGRLGWTQA
jgi:hypothetical protein